MRYMVLHISCLEDSAATTETIMPLSRDKSKGRCVELLHDLAKGKKFSKLINTNPEDALELWDQKELCAASTITTITNITTITAILAITTITTTIVMLASYG